MKKFFVLIGTALLLALSIQAQTTRKEMMHDIRKASAHYYPYFGGKDKLTPAPEGYTPFYISHYGRHGSRYIVNNHPYERMVPLFEKAEKEGKLTSLGKKTLKQLRIAAKDAEGKGGELSLLGGRQHEALGKRMYKNFPEVFSDGAHIDARSTTVHRCQVSMEHFCKGLKSQKPDLDIHLRTDKADRFFLAPDKDSVEALPTSKDVRDKLSATRDSLRKCIHISQKLFTDPSFIVQNGFDERQIMNDMYDITQDMLCLPELKLKFKKVFTKEELFNMFQVINLDWVNNCSLAPGMTPHYKSRNNLLRNIINWADEAIKQDKKGASLRFGHDSYILPLAFIMQLKGCYDVPADHFERLYEHYTCFSITPMASNLQMIFYRKPGSDDILVKFLYQEKETTIPIPTDMAPYYHWNDAKAFFLKRMAE